ncbi:MAG: nickel pincer cofactor biosynthesis protein LarC [Firmicutes bacterium]|nr:nickel pincer cofactor biosynthesis protein LarC [Bacillota bacterium]
MKILYFDCFSGASGDMILGALVAAGASLKAIKAELAKLPLSGYELQIAQVTKNGIAATALKVLVQEDQQPHRHYAEIKEMLANSSLTPEVKQLALDIFARLAEAEAKVHGVPPETVHFHEIGAVDSIVDIVGAAAALAEMKADRIYASALHTGCGTVRCAHGELPVPAPATLELLAGVPIYSRGIKGELLTPTGAAILTTVADFSPPPPYTVQKIGYGAGTKDLPIANVLRVIVGETESSSSYLHGSISVLESTIDDMNPEFFGYLTEQLLAAGAADVTLTPVYMKKNRPGTKLTVLVHPAQEQQVINMIFRETTTLGIRRAVNDKIMLSRRHTSIETEYGPVRIKVAMGKEGSENAAPEYEDCAKLARQKGVPLKIIYQAALAAYLQQEKKR